MMKKECRVVIYKEGLLGSLFFGQQMKQRKKSM